MDKNIKSVEKLGMNKESDAFLLPNYYKLVDLPFYKGDGNLSVKQLEALCNEFQEYCHQQAVIKQELLSIINNQAKF